MTRTSNVADYGWMNPNTPENNVRAMREAIAEAYLTRRQRTWRWMRKVLS